MRILVLIPHFYGPNSNSINSSTDPGKGDARRAALEQTLMSWRFTIEGSHRQINHNAMKSYDTRSGLHSISICVMVFCDNHTLSKDISDRYNINVVSFDNIDPKMLGFEARNVIANNIQNYDLFVYSEDDIAINDALFVEKYLWFNREFGYENVLMPHRFEISSLVQNKKVFLDHYLQDFQKYFGIRSNKEMLYASALGVNWVFALTRNPHSGMYLLTRDQVELCLKRGTFLSRDVSFVGPLESAATLGIMRNFSVYKTFGHSLDWFSVQHLDTRFSDRAL